MRYFFDTEFIEDGKTIDLISIAIVAKGGREYYAVNRDCRIEKASPWVWKNVLNPIGICTVDDRNANPGDPSISPRLRETLGAMQPHKEIGSGIIEFIYSKDYSPDPMPIPEFWAHYADYDWVVFCQLFGAMIDLPKSFPMYCKDIKQEADRLGIDIERAIPQQDKHHALADARWNKRAWEYIDSLEH